MRFAIVVALVLLGASASLRAGEARLTLSAAQRQALNLRLTPVAAGGEAAASALPARVVIPVTQERLLSAPVAGRIESLAVVPGSTVRRGQVLARIASPEALALQREALQAASQAGLMRENLQRDEALFKEGLIAESRVQATRAAAAQAAAQAVERRQGLAMLGVQAAGSGAPLGLVSPIDGVVLEQGVQLGQRVDASALIYRVARLLPLWLEAQLPVSQAAGVREGDRLRVLGQDIEGKVLALGRAIDPASQSLLLRAEVTGGAARLIPGQTVEVALSAAAGGHRIPAAALVRLRGEPLVFVLLADSAQGTHLAARPVRVLGQGGEHVRVEGLAPDNVIVTAGASSLKAMLSGVGAP